MKLISWQLPTTEWLHTHTTLQATLGIQSAAEAHQMHHATPYWHSACASTAHVRHAVHARQACSSLETWKQLTPTGCMGIQAMACMERLQLASNLPQPTTMLPDRKPSLYLAASAADALDGPVRTTIWPVLLHHTVLYQQGATTQP